MVVPLRNLWGVYLLISKEEGATFNPTYSVSVIFGKRDEVMEPNAIALSFLIDLCTHLNLLSFVQPMLEACARQLVEHIRYIL